ncbi:MAG TPA: hypothetical protein PK581_06345 [Caldisericia bacterium]|nr:hypothetical protein [Caldisericia bacterium]
MIDTKAAVKIALDYVRNLGISYLHDSLVLEEVKKTDSYWLITISYLRYLPIHQTRLEEMTSFGNLTRKPNSERVYKVIKIEDLTGNVIEMQIRELGN